MGSLSARVILFLQFRRDAVGWGYNTTDSCYRTTTKSSTPVKGAGGFLFAVSMVPYWCCLRGAGTLWTWLHSEAVGPQ